MIDPVVQNLLDQAKASASFEKSVDLSFQAQSAQIAKLQAQVSAITVGSMTDAEKADISATVSDLANSTSQLQKDVSANTPAAPAAPVEQPAAPAAPAAPASTEPPVPAAPADGSAPVAGTDPNAPAT